VTFTETAGHIRHGDVTLNVTEDHVAEGKRTRMVATP
jgi:hypothetical protein